jgi:hypothetical protein
MHGTVRFVVSAARVAWPSIARSGSRSSCFIRSHGHIRYQYLHVYNREEETYCNQSMEGNKET